MIFLIATIGFFVAAIYFFNNYEKTAANLCLVLCCVMGVCSIVFMGGSARQFVEADEILQNVSAQYMASDKADEDWEWAVAQCEKANKLAEEAENGANVWLDWPCVFGVPNAEDHSAIITEDRIEFPVDYNMLPLRKMG